MSDVPVVTVMNSCKGKGSEEFLKANVADIKDTLTFMYKKGMISKFHYEQWNKMTNGLDAETAHLWWDSITSGVMFEMESPKMEALEAMTEKMEEMAEKKVEMKVMMSSFGGGHSMGPKDAPKKMGQMKTMKKSYKKKMK